MASSSCAVSRNPNIGKTSSRAERVPEVFRAHLSKLLLNHSRGISVEKFAAYFKHSSKERIKFELYGYTSLTEMLEDLRDVCEVQKTSQRTMLFAVDDALKLRNRYRLDKRVQPTTKPEPDALQKFVTTLGELIVLRKNGDLYAPTCSLAQLAGFTKDTVLQSLEEDGIRVKGVHYLTVGDPHHEELRLKIAVWCPLACSENEQIVEKIALVPLKSCNFIVAALSPDIPQDNAVRKLRIISSFKMTRN
ncbi:uncharacterized protein LOC100905140 [Galendromus occidentalis]|uniref:Uncharacterized protein LOC100905140 n=1 Tax=Galendromus occidentalis TaxID=34638 RepID=A0AAJ6QTX6_9ACAR|nr:uncharacterized protein LOC100905140 [Galendromus occidentalis]